MAKWTKTQSDYAVGPVRYHIKLDGTVKAVCYSEDDAETVLSALNAAEPQGRTFTDFPPRPQPDPLYDRFVNAERLPDSAPAAEVSESAAEIGSGASDCANCGHSSGLHPEDAKGCSAIIESPYRYIKNSRCGCSNFKRRVLAALDTALSEKAQGQVGVKFLLISLLAVCLHAETRSQRMWKWSAAALVAGASLDSASSWGRQEGNPMLRGPDGRFGPRGLAVKSLGVSGAILAGWVVMRKHPQARVPAVANFALGYGLGLVSVRNYRIR